MWSPIKLGKRRGKYGNTKIVIDGVKYDSRFEAKVLTNLRTMEAGGFIKDLIYKPKYEFIVEGNPIRYVGKNGRKGRKITYTADAKYYDNALEKTVVVDVKGFETDVFP